MESYAFITYTTTEDGRVARIALDRPDSRNAQNRGMLVELDDAFGRAEADDRVRVVVLSGNGPDFSAGHDLGTAQMRAEREPGPDQHESFTCNGATRGPSRAGTARNTTTTTTTPGAGGSCARSPSRRCTGRFSRRP